MDNAMDKINETPAPAAAAAEPVATEELVDRAAPIGGAAAALAGVETPVTRRSVKFEREEALRRAKADPDAIRRAFETGTYPYADRLTEGAYLKQMAALQVELMTGSDVSPQLLREAALEALASR